MKKFVVLLTLLSVMLFCQGVFAQTQSQYIMITITGQEDSTTYNVAATAIDWEIESSEDPESVLQNDPTDYVILVDSDSVTFTYTTQFAYTPEPGVNSDIIEPVVVNPVTRSYTFNVTKGYGDLTWGDEPGPAPVAPTEIIPSSFSVVLTPRTTTQITLFFVPEDASDSVQWLSLDPSIATVDDDGNIVAVAPGITTVLAISNVDQDVVARIQVVVNQGRQDEGGMNFFDIGPAKPVGSFCNDCTLPATGFSSRAVTKLSEQPASVNYTDLNMRVQIPSLNVDAEIATVPVVDNAWAVEWLGDKAGLLSGTYLPGEGTTILAGHNTLNTTEWGPFAMLATLDVNDAIFVTDADNQLQSFRVYANELLGPNDMEKLASIAETFENSLVLVTCENEAVSGGYMNRRVVFAKPN